MQSCFTLAWHQWHQSVLQMAAASGDMRRALEGCTAALELKVQEAVAEQADLAVNALVTGMQDAEPEGQQQGQDLNSAAQHAQQAMPAGGVLTKPRPVGIGHMCRAISTLTGGLNFSLR